MLHRDLKPANIFVTADGTVKLLDFGIAKLRASGAVPGMSATTTMAMRVMTPAYASPEQVRGQPLSVTSDVYALGVVLYELLTGHWPYRTQGRLLHEVTRAICEEEPALPSTVVGQVEDAPGEKATHPLTPETVSEVREGTPARLRRRLEGDLDNILLKALDKESARRYRSVDQFSEDVRRHLAGLPVAARDDNYRYRAGKFVRRLEHSTQALLLLYTIGVLAGAMIALASWRIARRFGWRGLAGFVVFVSIVGPIRDRLYLTAAHLMVVVPGSLPWIENTLSWACGLLLSHAVMRLMAGPARDDRLARRWWSST